MNETVIIYGLVAGFVFLLVLGMRWLAPHLDRWADAQDRAEWERRRPKYPKPPYLPPSQYPKLTHEQVRLFEQNFNESLHRIGVLGTNVMFQPFPPIPNYRVEPDIEDEP